MGTFLFRGIDPDIASAKSMSDPLQSINLAQLNPQVVPTKKKEQPRARFNLDNLYVSSSKPFAQVTSVAKLADVHSTDWAFGELQSLRERYGCPVKYFYTTLLYNSVRPPLL